MNKPIAALVSAAVLTAGCGATPVSLILKCKESVVRCAYSQPGIASDLSESSVRKEIGKKSSSIRTSCNMVIDDKGKEVEYCCSKGCR